MPSFITDISPATNELDTLTINPDTSIGIEQVRQIQYFLSRKPQNSTRSTVIINSAHLLTLPAQNAILKILEEPPTYADIYLITKKPDILIPTIISRTFSTSQSSRTLNPDHDIQSAITQFLSTSITSERLKILEPYSTREELALFLDQFEYHLHIHLNSDAKRLTDHWLLLIKAKKYLSANCSVRLILNYLLVNL